jgi:hypothetical protein
MKNHQMSLFQFYSYIDGSLHISGLQAHPQENSHSCSHNHWFIGCTFWAACSVQSTRPERYNHWTNGCVNNCMNSPEDGPVGPKHVEIRRNRKKIEIVTSVGSSFHMLKGFTVQKASNTDLIYTTVQAWNHARLNAVQCRTGARFG